MVLATVGSFLALAAVVHAVPASNHVLIGVLWHYHKATRAQSLYITDSPQSHVHFARCSNGLTQDTFMQNQPFKLDVDDDGFGQVFIGDIGYPIAYEGEAMNAGSNVMTCRRTSSEMMAQLNCVMMHPGQLAGRMSPNEIPQCLPRALGDGNMQFELMKRANTSELRPLQNPGFDPPFGDGPSCGFRYPVVKVDDGSPKKKMLCKQMTVGSIFF